MISLYITNKDSVYQPITLEGITWSTERKNVPGKLEFSVLKDELLKFTEGNQVDLYQDNVKVFRGYIFTKQRNKDGIIKVTAYDQLRYLKNKDYMWYKNLTAAGVVQRIATDYNLKIGEIQDTEFVIEARNEDTQTMFDIIQNALDLTLMNKRKMYVLYDEFGKLMLKNIETMKLDLLIDEETGENYNYTSSIDKQTYNQIKLYRDNKESGFREIYIAQNSAHQNEWGLLKLTESIEENCNGKVKADAYLQLYDRKTRDLSIDNAFGDIRVRAGTSVIVKLNLGDIKVSNYFIVERAKHKFTNNLHTMDLALRGGDFIA